MWWMNTVPVLLEQHNSVIYVCISILQFKSTLFLVLMLHCMHFVFRGFSATQVRTHSELKSVEPFVWNVMKSHRLSDPFLAQIILLRGEVHLSIQLPVPSRFNVLKQCVCEREWASQRVLVTHKGYITRFCSCSLESFCSPSLNHPITADAGSSSQRVSSS